MDDPSVVIGLAELDETEASPRRMTSKLKLSVSGPQGGPDSGAWAAADELSDSKTNMASSAGAPLSNSRFCISILLSALA